MDNTDYIESYFKNTNNDLEKKQFENKILEDASFAEEVAFYISANKAIQQQLLEEKKQKFREIYEQQKVVSIKQPVKYLWKYIAAASIVIAISAASWFLLANKTSPQQLADKYIQQNFTTLGVTMSSRQDSVQTGLNLFNAQKFTGALSIFETLAKRDTANDDAKKYAGIVSLRLNNYDKALGYFSRLEADTSLYSNPGKLYKAITLLKRNKSGDKEAAKLLLEQVRDNYMEGKEEAEELLKKF